MLQAVIINKITTRFNSQTPMDDDQLFGQQKDRDTMIAAWTTTGLLNYTL